MKIRPLALLTVSLLTIGSAVTLDSAYAGQHPKPKTARRASHSKSKAHHAAAKEKGHKTETPAKKHSYLKKHTGHGGNPTKNHAKK